MTLPLDAEPIRPGESEVAAAIRLLRRVFDRHGRLVDAVVADSLYLQAPFVHFCLDHQRHVIAVLKQNNPALLEDAQAVFRTVEPRTWEQGRKTILYWDAEEFETSDAIRQPLRILRARETTKRRHRIAGQWVTEAETADWWWATTIPQAQLSTRSLASVGHRRWDIENDVFNVLANDWALNHCFKHDPTAILNFILTLFIAFVLVQSFYRRDLKPQCRELFSTLVSITVELHASLAATRGFHSLCEARTARPP